MRIGYLVNTYPSPSHSFIRREIRALERLDIDVRRFAVRGDSALLVDPDDRAEAMKTERLLDHGGLALVRAMMIAAVRTPLAFLGALRLIARVSRASPRGMLYHIAYLAEAALLVERCRASGVGHVHAHFGTNSATVAMLANALEGPTYSFTVHGPEEFDNPRGLALGEKMRRAAFAVGVSAFGRSQLYRWVDHTVWPRIKVVHCGIDPERFGEPLAMPDGATRIVSIGRLAEQKGQILLIDAVADALATQPNLHLTLVGDGPMRGAIVARIRERGLSRHVTITGWVDEARVRAELAAAHALVMPSFAEGLPMVIMEAMAAGRPVISTYIAGIPELVRPGETGWLVPAGDVRALTAALRALDETPREQLATMGAAGRLRALERHNVNREALRLAAHFADAFDVRSLREARLEDLSQAI